MTQWQDRILETKEGDPAELVKMLHPDNPKAHPEEQMEGLEHSLEKVGWIDRPIWNKRTNYFLDGNGRVKLALLAGQASIRYDVVDLSPEEEQYVLLTFDPLGGMAEPDAVKLLALMNQVGEDLPEPVAEHLLGMVGEVEETGENGEGEGPEPQLDRAAELQEKWGTKLGQLWQLGEHRLVCGDCTDRAVVERVMGGKKAKAIVTDPPYGINANVDYTRFSGFARGVSPTRGRDFGDGIANDDKPFDPSPLLDYKTVILWGANYYDLPRGTWLVWDKRYKGQDKILSDGELGWVNRGIGVYIFNHGWNGFMRESERGKTLHPTQKPVVLFEWCMQWLDDNDTIVYDPYCGSGPIIIACQNLNRQCRAIEISPAYVAVTLQRFYDHTNIDPVLLEDPQ